MVRIGVDAGGTFTDFTITHAGTGTNLYVKLPSTPTDSSTAIVDGFAQIVALHGMAMLFITHNLGVVAQVAAVSR